MTKRSPIVEPEPDPYENEPEAQPSRFLEDLGLFRRYVLDRYRRQKPWPRDRH